MKTKPTLSHLLAILALALLPLAATLTPQKAIAQCGINNTAFKSGEFLYYDLFFNWKFIWVKVGTASMSTVESVYDSKPAFRTSLITRSNNRADKLFMMRDTLLSYTTKDIVPLYFRKGAREGKRYYVDEMWYSHPGGSRTHLKQHAINSRGEHKWKTSDYNKCIYDMMSIFLRARNFNASKLKKGQNIKLPISDASNMTDSWLKFMGKETFKMDGTNDKYRCLVFGFFEKEDNKDHEIIRFYITDDANHIPVRLDMFLSFGSAKAFLKGYKGIRSPMTSKLK